MFFDYLKIVTWTDERPATENDQSFNEPPFNEFFIVVVGENIVSRDILV